MRPKGKAQGIGLSKGEKKQANAEGESAKGLAEAKARKAKKQRDGQMAERQNWSMQREKRRVAKWQMPKLVKFSAIGVGGAQYTDDLWWAEELIGWSSRAKRGGGVGNRWTESPGIEQFVPFC
ncbi:hypothetical protein niasHS_001770 [Heterodera schachtii]|uniref:Small EDRK-rich factor-like N-terminal domain-containing protein n=1 Tax=Heterodera schachtii TaxID=97005 RepID=A0ABD2K8B5_HETSC